MKSKLVAITASILAIAAVVAIAGVRVPARSDEGPDGALDLVRYVIIGFQADSSSAFVLHGDLVGDSGLWERVAGPVLDTASDTIPAAGTFGGAGCQMEYSQDRIVADDGSTIIVNAYGLRCAPNGSLRAHITNGSYDIAGGTGRFKDFLGTGTVTIDVRPDGSAFILVGGTGCNGGACGGVRRGGH